MTTILFVFIIALIISLAITPVAGILGERFGDLDTPTARKVHTKPVPRSGGLAIEKQWHFIGQAQICADSKNNSI